MSQQPGEVYPYNPNSYPSTPAQPSSHSNGSFAPVLIVLAVILVVTIIAVVVGRCGYPKGSGKAANRKGGGGGGGKKKGKGGGGVAAGKLSNGKFQESDEGGDIEFGFGNKRISTSKVANGNPGPPAGGPMMPQRSDPRGPRMMPMPMPMPNHQSGGGGGGGGGGRGHHHVRFGDHNDVINPSQFHPGS